MEAPRAVGGRYRLEHAIGRGGSGEVYRARDLQSDVPVALKIVRPERLNDPEAQRRFLHDAQILSTLHHPAIVTVLDYGIFAEGGGYIATELIRGEDLRRVLQREGRLEPQRALSILSVVCDAIEAAHREGVVHGDLKPENILLPDDDGVEVKVLDFGVAKGVSCVRVERVGAAADAPLLAAAGMIVGTPAYMAPEQFRGVEPDVRSDVFSLGVIAYEVLSGKLPFGHGAPTEIALAQARGVLPVSDVRIPAAAERAIRTALDPDPDWRPASPRALAHLLSAALGMAT